MFDDFFDIHLLFYKELLNIFEIHLRFMYRKFGSCLEIATTWLKHNNMIRDDKALEKPLFPGKMIF